jgi:hypothetical protein
VRLFPNVFGELAQKLSSLFAARSTRAARVAILTAGWSSFRFHFWLWRATPREVPFRIILAQAVIFRFCRALRKCVISSKEISPLVINRLNFLGLLVIAYLVPAGYPWLVGTGGIFNRVNPTVALRHVAHVIRSPSHRPLSSP